jgi:hypothetical protein
MNFTATEANAKGNFLTEVWVSTYMRHVENHFEEWK